MDEPKTKGRTMRAAHQLKVSGASDMALAGELIEIRVARGDAELSLLARRALLLMLEAAAGDAWSHQFHRIAKQELRGSHGALDRVRPALDELLDVNFAMPGKIDGRPSTRRFPLLDEVADHNDNTASSMIEFRFSSGACEVLRKSEVYARLSREAIVKFQSRYSLRCYELGALFYRRRDPVWRGDVKALRELLQVPDGVYTNFAQLRRRVLEAARDEIRQLAEFDMDWTEQRRGRQVMRVELRFTAKPGRKALAAAEERARHSSGRAARREGTTEILVPPAAVAGVIRRATSRLTGDLTWPADDKVSEFDSDPELYRIGKEHGAGHAVDRIAAAYAGFMGNKRHLLTGDRLRTSWRGFCETVAGQWGAV